MFVAIFCYACALHRGEAPPTPLKSRGRGQQIVTSVSRFSQWLTADLDPMLSPLDTTNTALAPPAAAMAVMCEQSTNCWHITLQSLSVTCNIITLEITFLY